MGYGYHKSQMGLEMERGDTRERERDRERERERLCEKFDLSNVILMRWYVQ
jgi:hypothetical protein